MNVSPPALLAVIAGILLGLLVPGEPARPGVRKRRAPGPPAATASAWEAAGRLEAHWAHALEHAQAAAGRRYEDPPELVVHTPEQMRPVLMGLLGPWLRSAGPPPAALLEAAAARLPVVADPTGRVVYAVPAAARALAQERGAPVLLSPEGCRLLLTFGALQALDAQRYPALREALGGRTEPDGLAAAWALALGHAAWHTEHVAAPGNLGLAPTFQGLASALGGPPPSGAAPQGPEAAVAGLLAQGWVTGLGFVRELKRHKAPIAEALEAPPATLGALERADRYLAGRRLLKAFDGERALMALREALAAAGAQVEVRDAGLGAIEALLSAAERERVHAVLGGLRRAQHLVAAAEDGRPAAEAWLVLLADDAAATEFAALREAHDRAMEARLADSPTPIRDARYEEYTGRDRGLPGYTVERVEASPAGESRVRLQVAVEGPYVLQFLVRDGRLRREPQIDALEAAVDALREVLAPPRRR